MKKTNLITNITNTKPNERKDERKIKKTNRIKTRIIAIALSTITVFSIGSVAVTSAGAANTTFENNAKSRGIQIADAAFDTIGGAFPGAKILVAPLKGLFHTTVDGHTNPLDTINSKLEQLNDTIEKNTEWMAAKVENAADMSDLRADFKGLSPQVAKLVKDVKAAETNPKLNNSQKIMRLAAITDTRRYDAVTTYIYNIRKAMDGTDPAYVNMFKTLYSKYAVNSMFACEAYRAAAPTAEALIEQYVFAVLLTEECQTATQAVDKFTDANIKELGGDIDIYNRFDRYRHAMDNDDGEKEIITAAIAVKDFKTKYDRPAFINKNANTDGKIVKLSTIDCKNGGIFNYTLKGYDRVGTVSAIRMSDPKVAVSPLTLFTYQSWGDDRCSSLMGTYKDVKTTDASVPYHDYLTIK